MSISLIPTRYRTRNFPAGSNFFLLANAGQKVEEDLMTLELSFNFKSSGNDQIRIDSENSLQMLNGTWGDKGVVIGDSLNIQFSATINGGLTTVNATRTVVNIVGNIITFNNPFANPIIIGQVSPMSSGSDFVTPITITNSRQLPEQIEVYHSLINNANNANKNSLVDGSQNRFLANDVDLMAVSDVVQLVQMGNNSGGSYTSSSLKRIADTASGLKAFEIKFSYYSPWKIDGQNFDKPDYLDNSQSLKPCYFVKAFPEENNPNAGLSIEYAYNNGNVGWYNENYNGGLDDFTVNSVLITDSAGNPISEVDHNQTCNVIVEIEGTAPIKDFAEVEFYFIPPENEYKNNQFLNAQNLLLSNFTADTSGVIALESFVKNGAEMQTANQIVTALVGNTITVKFDLVPNSQFASYINSFQSQERLYRISVNIEESGGTDNENNSVSKIIQQGVLTKAPIPDQPFNDVVNSGFVNHWEDAATVTPSNTYVGTTEDDFMYLTKFNLDYNDPWERIDLSVEVIRNSDGASFVLEDRSINFASFVTDSNGVIQFVGNAATQSIQQFLDAPLRNQLKIENTGVSTGTNYEVSVKWSLMANWRYWQSLNSAFIDFFDVSLPNNGQNNNWVRYLQLAGYSIRVFSRLVKGGVAYFWSNNILLDVYDDDPNIVSSDPVLLDSSGAVIPIIIPGQDITVRCDHALVSGVWDQANTYGWISQRGFEQDPNKRISTVWDWTSQSNPLKPKTGLTKAELTFPSPNIARVECLIDTNQINSNDVSLISRIKSPINDPELLYYQFFNCDPDDSTQYTFTGYTPLTVGKSYQFNEVDGCYFFQEYDKLELGTTVVTVASEWEDCETCLINL